MKKHLHLLLLFSSAFFLLPACNTATPQKYFETAVLSTNMLMGFAGDGMLRQLDEPSVKLDEGSNQPVPEKRKEFIVTKIQFFEDNFRKLTALKETPETKDLLAASRALHEYVLPVYKNEYLQLAKMYDDNAPKENIQAAAQAIRDKYYARFDELSEQLTVVGKAYTEKNNIKVNWGS